MQNKTQFISIISILLVAVVLSQFNAKSTKELPLPATGEIVRSTGTGGGTGSTQQSTSFCRPNPSGGSGSGTVPTDTDCVDSFKADNNPCVAPQVLSNVVCSTTATPTKCARIDGKEGYICKCKYECVNP